jgi:hypothetical protein
MMIQKSMGEIPVQLLVVIVVLVQSAYFQPHHQQRGGTDAGTSGAGQGGCYHYPYRPPNGSPNRSAVNCIIIVIGSSPAVKVRVTARIVSSSSSEKPGWMVILVHAAAGPNIIIIIITVDTRFLIIGRLYHPSERSPKEPVVQ